jgi:hypothetical protein
VYEGLGAVPLRCAWRRQLVAAPPRATRAAKAEHKEHRPAVRRETVVPAAAASPRPRAAPGLLAPGLLAPGLLAPGLLAPELLAPELPAWDRAALARNRAGLQARAISPAEEAPRELPATPSLAEVAQRPADSAAPARPVTAVRVERAELQAVVRRRVR